MFVAYLCSFPVKSASDVLMPNFFLKLFRRRLLGCPAVCLAVLVRCVNRFWWPFGCRSFFWKLVRANFSVVLKFLLSSWIGCIFKWYSSWLYGSHMKRVSTFFKAVEAYWTGALRVLHCSENKIFPWSKHSRYSRQRRLVGLGFQMFYLLCWPLHCVLQALYITLVSTFRWVVHEFNLNYISVVTSDSRSV